MAEHRIGLLMNDLLMRARNKRLGPLSEKYIHYFNLEILDIQIRVESSSIEIPDSSRSKSIRSRRISGQIEQRCCQMYRSFVYRQSLNVLPKLCDFSNIA